MENKKEITDLNDIDLNDTVGDDEEIEFGVKMEQERIMETLIYTYIDNVEYKFEKVNKRNCRLYLCYVKIFYQGVNEYDDSLSPKENLINLFDYSKTVPDDFDMSIFEEWDLFVHWEKLISGELDIQDFDKHIDTLINSYMEYDIFIFKDDFYEFNDDNGNITIKKNGVKI
jgi:hypothetical protein